MFLTIKLCTHAKLNYLKETDYLYKINLALNNLQRLICHQPNQPTNQQLNQLFSFHLWINCRADWVL